MGGGQVTVEEFVNVLRMVKARVSIDRDRAREARRMARDAGGYDSGAYHRGRMDGIEEAMRAVHDAMERRRPDA